MKSVEYYLIVIVSNKCIIIFYRVYEIYVRVSVVPRHTTHHLGDDDEMDIVGSFGGPQGGVDSERG